MATILVGAAVLIAAVAALWKVIADRCAGKGSCGGDCSKCRGCR